MEEEAKRQPITGYFAKTTRFNSVNTQVQNAEDDPTMSDYYQGKKMIALQEGELDDDDDTFGDSCDEKEREIKAKEVEIIKKQHLTDKWQIKSTKLQIKKNNDNMKEEEDDYAVHQQNGD